MRWLLPLVSCVLTAPTFFLLHWGVGRVMAMCLALFPRWGCFVRKLRESSASPSPLPTHCVVWTTGLVASVVAAMRPEKIAVDSLEYLTDKIIVFFFLVPS